MMRKFPMVLGFVLLSIISAGLAMAEAHKNEAEPYVANFQYTPDARKAPGSGGVTFAVAAPEYLSDSKTLWPLAPQFAKFGAAVREDLSEILSAKGFSVRGPFASSDSIPYSDKKAIDLNLVPTIEIKTIVPEETYRIADIKIEVVANITLKLKEIATGELLWTKSVPFKPLEISGAKGWKGIQWKGLANSKDAYDDTIKKTIDRVELGPANYDAMAQGLEKQYPDTMATIFTLFDPKEMRILKKQAQELKRKKEY